MKNLENLTTKKITEFDSDDTLYIRKTDDFNKPLYLCKFIKFEKNKIFGEILLNIGDNRYKDKNRGVIISAKLSDCALYGKGNGDIKHPFYHFFDNTLRAHHPMEEYKQNNLGDLHVKNHPSYGLIRVGRINGGNNALFGSSIKHNNRIEIEIQTAEHKRDLNSDRYHPCKSLISVEMSQTQFAEMITSLNNGVGTPCTIKYLDGERQPETPFNSKIDVFQQEFSNKMHNLGVDMEKLMGDTLELLNSKKTINKGDRDVITNQIKKVLQNIKSNIPFVSNQFNEQMEKTVTEAKGEIEAFVDGKIRNLGLEAFKEELKELKESVNIKDE